MNLFFELIQVSLGVNDRLSRVPTDKEWDGLYDEAEHQAVLGVVLHGIDRLPAEQRPYQILLLQWIGQVEKVKQQNLILNKKVAELQELFAKEEIESCVLKGQGNARLYPEPLYRMSGDIDLWTNGERASINKFIASIVKESHKGYKHIAFQYKDVEVEVHYFPTYLNNYRNNRKLQRYIAEHQEAQFKNQFEIGSEQERYIITIPTNEFNLIYQMAHLYHHFFCEGIGLRHFIDYYYLLKQDDLRGKKENVKYRFKEFGMMKFARGVMWIEKELLRLEDKYLVDEIDEKTGRMILKEMMTYGNFNNEGLAGRSSLTAKLTNTFKPFKYLFTFPGGSADRVMFLGWLQIWKLQNYLNKR